MLHTLIRSWGPSFHGTMYRNHDRSHRSSFFTPPHSSFGTAGGSTSTSFPGINQFPQQPLFSLDGEGRHPIRGQDVYLTASTPYFDSPKMMTYGPGHNTQFDSHVSSSYCAPQEHPAGASLTLEDPSTYWHHHEYFLPNSPNQPDDHTDANTDASTGTAQYYGESTYPDYHDTFDTQYGYQKSLGKYYPKSRRQTTVVKHRNLNLHASIKK